MSITWSTLKPNPEAGAAITIDCTIVDANGAGVNIAGWQHEFWIRNLDDPSETYDLSARVSVVTTNPGKVRARLLRADVKTFGDKNMFGEFWRVDGDNDAVYAKGPIRFDPVARSQSEA